MLKGNPSAVRSGWKTDFHDLQGTVFEAYFVPGLFTITSAAIRLLYISGSHANPSVLCLYPGVLHTN